MTEVKLRQGVGMVMWSAEEIIYFLNNKQFSIYIVNDKWIKDIPRLCSSPLSRRRVDCVIFSNFPSSSFQENLLNLGTREDKNNQNKIYADNIYGVCQFTQYLFLSFDHIGLPLAIATRAFQWDKMNRVLHKTQLNLSRELDV